MDELEKQRRMQFVFPISIVQDRYGGTYSERGPWLAFPCEPWEVPRDPFDDDTTARNWWSAARLPIGGGRTPDEACGDLVERLFETPPNQASGPKGGEDTYMWTWRIRWRAVTRVLWIASSNQIRLVRSCRPKRPDVAIRRRSIWPAREVPSARQKRARRAR